MLTLKTATSSSSALETTLNLFGKRSSEGLGGSRFLQSTPCSISNGNQRRLGSGLKGWAPWSKSPVSSTEWVITWPPLTRQWAVVPKPNQVTIILELQLSQTWTKGNVWTTWSTTITYLKSLIFWMWWRSTAILKRRTFSMCALSLSTWRCQISRKSQLTSKHCCRLFNTTKP